MNFDVLGEPLAYPFVFSFRNVQKQTAGDKSSNQSRNEEICFKTSHYPTNYSHPFIYSSQLMNLVHKNTPTDLSHLSPVHNFPYYCLTIRFNIILPSMLRYFCMVSFVQDLKPTLRTYLSTSGFKLHAPSRVDHLNDILWKAQTMQLLNTTGAVLLSDVAFYTLLILTDLAHYQGRDFWTILWLYQSKASPHFA